MFLSPYYFSLGESNWLIVATGVADCYYNVTDLPSGATYRFRVACVNKAGQGPYSNLSEKVTLGAAGTFHSDLLYFTFNAPFVFIYFFICKTVNIANDEFNIVL